MQLALEQAKIAFNIGEVPVGAIMVYNNNVIAKSHNLTLTKNDPSAHAEMNVIRESAKLLGDWRIDKCELYVTLEPCPMCAQAISFSRIAKLFYGAPDFKGGGVENGARIFNQSSCFHKPQIFGGIMEQECGDILKTFFKLRRL